MPASPKPNQIKPYTWCSSCSCSSQKSNFIFLNPHVPIPPPSYNPLIPASTTYYPSTVLPPPKPVIFIPLIHPNSSFKNQTLCNHLGFISFVHPSINGCNSLRSLPEFTAFFSSPFYTTLTTLTTHYTFI